jgi:hypothetical protein
MSATTRNNFALDSQDPVLSLDDVFATGNEDETARNSEPLHDPFSQPLAFGDQTSPQALITEQIGEPPRLQYPRGDFWRFFNLPSPKVLGVLGLVLAGAVGAIVTSQDDVWGRLMILLGLTETPPMTEAAAQPDRAKALKAQPAMAPAPRPQFRASMIQNPYWMLPNELASHPLPMGASWSRRHEEAWRRGLNHHFPYQHYKTTKTIRESRLKGSELLLFEALDDKKFWTRMNAAIGLAEFGYRIDIATVEKALGKANQSLIKNYFKRFDHSATPGELYVMRQAIRLVAAPARKQILSILLATNQDKDRIYLAAAAFDPAQSLKKWFVEENLPAKIPASVMDNYKNLVVDDFTNTRSSVDEVGEVHQVNTTEHHDDSTINEVEYFQEKIDSEVEAPAEAPGAPQSADGFEDLNARELPATSAPTPH